MRKLLLAFGYSKDGLIATFRTQFAFRLEVACLAIALFLVCAIDFTALERAVLIAVSILVLIVELLNTAIEATIDRFSTEIHPLSKLAKDASSAAVLLSATTAAIVWLILLASVWCRD